MTAVASRRSCFVRHSLTCTRKSQFIKLISNSCDQLQNIRPPESESNGEFKRRDISGLSRFHRKIERGIFPGRSRSKKDLISYKRQMLGIYGSYCPYQPTIAWPSRDELRTMKQIEAQFEPALDKLLAEMKIQQEEDLKERLERYDNIVKRMEEMPKLIKQYNAKQSAKLEAKLRVKEKKQKLLDEARDFFGYEVNPLDAKFQEMVLQKEKEEKLAEKQRKKEEKIARMVAKFQSLASHKVEKPNDEKTDNIDSIINDEKTPMDNIDDDLK